MRSSRENAARQSHLLRATSMITPSLQAPEEGRDRRGAAISRKASVIKTSKGLANLGCNLRISGRYFLTLIPLALSWGDTWLPLQKNDKKCPSIATFWCGRASGSGLAKMTRRKA